MPDSADSSASIDLATEDVPTCCLCGDGPIEYLASRARLHEIPGRSGLAWGTACILVPPSPGRSNRRWPPTTLRTATTPLASRETSPEHITRSELLL